MEAAITQGSYSSCGNIPFKKIYGQRWMDGWILLKYVTRQFFGWDQVISGPGMDVVLSFFLLA